MKATRGRDEIPRLDRSSHGSRLHGGGEPFLCSGYVPVDYFVDIILDEPFPVTIESGRPILLRGTIEDRSVLGISALFHRFPNARRKVFSGAVSFGAFEIWIVFNHDDVGTYTMAFQTLSGGTLRFTPITVVRGPDEQELPPKALRSLGDRGYFEPAVVSLNEEFLPPLYVQAGVNVAQVVALVLYDDGRDRSFPLREDGLAGDRVAQDGVFTLATLPLYEGSLDFGDHTDFGAVGATIQITADDGTFDGAFAICGVVAGIPSPVRAVSSVAQRTDHILNVADTRLFDLANQGIDLGRAVSRFYDFFSDDYDFVTVRPSFSMRNGLAGFNIIVNNQTNGIGVARKDSSADFGSARRLRSASFINLLPVVPHVHELAHTWSNFLDLFESRSWGAHLGVSDVGGVLGGQATFDEVEPGVYEIPVQALNSFWGGKLSMPELYLMGLVGPEQVPDHLVLQDWEVESFDGETLLVTGHLDTVSVEEIVAAEGRRNPTHEQAQRDFRMATIVVSPELLSPVELTWFDRQAIFVGSDIDHDLAFAAATGYRATLDTRLDVVTTAVFESTETPDDFTLVANYPNPFNSTTTITFSFETQERVSLVIYDVVGRRVRTLVRKTLSPGQHSIRWDGVDEQGRAAASGVYLAHLVTPTSRQVRRMSLVR